MKQRSTHALAALARLLAGGVLLLAGCDEIEEEARLTGPLPFEIRKNVLIEDFTGQGCLNCPLAADKVHELQETYGAEHVVAVAVHGGSLSISAAQGGLATQQGNDYVGHWGVEAFPQGMVDRSGGLMDYAQWTGKAFERLQRPAAVGILLQNAYDAQTRTLLVHVSLTAAQALGGAHLQLWLTEDDVTGLQAMPEGTVNRDYVHQHVFRAAVNGLWGQEVTLEEGAQRSYDCTAVLEEGWKPENVRIVAFVYDDDGVLQTVAQPVACEAAEE